MGRAAGALYGDFGRIALIDIGQPIKAHVHPHAHVLFKMGGVDSTFSVSNRFVPMTDETVVLVNSWEPHCYPRDGVAGSSLILGLYIEPKWLQLVDPWFHLTTNSTLFSTSCIAVSKRIRELLHDAAAAARDDKWLTCSHEHLVATLMCEIARAVSWTAHDVPERRSPIVRDFRIRRAIHFMKEQVADAPRDMDEIARSCALSRAHFFELFKENVGIPPLLFFHALRMEAAYQALVRPEGTVAEIGARLGFSAPSHFTRFFRDHLGATPSEFRQAVSH